MSLSDPWEIDQYAKRQIERELLNKLGLSLNIYGSPNVDDSPYFFHSNVESQINNDNIQDYSV